MKRLALYTTIHPGVRSFLKDWYGSVRGQTDQDFRIWIGLDAMEIEAACGAMGVEPPAIWVRGVPGDTPAQIRQRALERIVEACDGVVLVDSDDVLHPTRVAAAREALQTSDLAGCALRLVDEGGGDLGLNLGLPQGSGPGDVLPRNNVYGLSNTAYRSDLMRQCLPIPDDALIVDWFLATRAWLCGSRLFFDNKVRMDYRQHGTNMVRVTPPFSPDQVVRDTRWVRRHFQIVRTVPVQGLISGRLAEMEEVAADVERFHERVVLCPEVLVRYVQALNDLEPEPLWWSCVANPVMRPLWA